MKNSLLLILFVGLITACQQPTPYDHIPSSEVRTILEKGINAAGGLDNWKQLGPFSFDKRTILYLEDGSIEVKNRQKVTFQNFPSLQGLIEWNNPSDTVKTKIVFDSEKAIKYIDEEALDNETNEAARATFLGAHIVMSLPFKLLDHGVQLSYVGKGVQYDQDVEILLAEYNENEENHTETHRWWHYFDAESFEYLGYKVFHPPTYALVKNLKTTQLGGISFPVDRITWRVDSLDRKQYIRAKFAYADFQRLD